MFNAGAHLSFNFAGEKKNQNRKNESYLCKDLMN